MGLVLAVAGSGGGMNLWSILLHAHPVSKVIFALLVICSVLSVAVIIERWLVLNRAQRATQEAALLLNGWMANRQGAAAHAEIAGAMRDVSPLLSVLRAGIASGQEMVAVGETHLEVIESMVSQAMAREVKLVRAMLRANLSILANIGSNAPFIGLFGTVVGIILTFDSIARTGNMGQELVASGIADALVATAMGLFAAIPAIIAYNYFTDRINTFVLGMEETAMEHIYYLMQTEHARETV